MRGGRLRIGFAIAVSTAIGVSLASNANYLALARSALGGRQSPKPPARWQRVHETQRSRGAAYCQTATSAGAAAVVCGRGNAGLVAVSSSPAVFMQGRRLILSRMQA